MESLPVYYDIIIRLSNVKKVIELAGHSIAVQRTGDPNKKALVQDKL